MEQANHIPNAILVDASTLTPRNVSQGSVYYANQSDSKYSSLRKKHTNELGFGVLFLRTTTLNKSGKVVVPKYLTLTLLLTGASIDLSQAIFVHPVTTVNVISMLGTVKVYLPLGVRVEVNGISLLGSFKQYDPNNLNSNRVMTDSPLVKLNGVSILGGAKVHFDLTSPPLFVTNQ